MAKKPTGGLIKGKKTIKKSLCPPKKEWGTEVGILAKYPTGGLIRGEGPPQTKKNKRYRGNTTIPDKF